MKAKNMRNARIKYLKELRKRSQHQITKEDYAKLIDLMIELTRKAYAQDIHEEESEERHEEIMSEMDWHDFN